MYAATKPRILPSFSRPPRAGRSRRGTRWTTRRRPASTAPPPWLRAASAPARAARAPVRGRSSRRRRRPPPPPREAPRPRRGGIDGNAALHPRQVRGAPRHDAGSPPRTVRRNVTPSRSACGPVGAPPTLATPLCPAPMPRTVRPMRGDVHRGRRRGGDGGMTSHEVGHAGGEPDARGGGGGEGHGHPRIHGVARRVGDADHVEAELFPEARQARGVLGRVRPEEEAEAHAAAVRASAGG